MHRRPATYSPGPSRAKQDGRTGEWAQGQTMPFSASDCRERNADDATQYQM